MIRFVLSPDGVVTPDVKRRLPGRGVWIDATRASVAEAAKKRVFSRAFKAEAKVSPNLADDIAALLRRAALERLSMAQKAGTVVAGFEKVRAAVRDKAVTGLVFASDASEDGRQKVEALAKKALELHNKWSVADVFSSAELESTLGRQRVVHVALAPGRTSDLFFTDALRLRGYEFGPLHPADVSNHTDEHMFAGSLTV